jgi:methylenetetrahydrofolate dehydrogenase (NADP+) / methenyltetrahydrofolate cyclohydrolase
MRADCNAPASPEPPDESPIIAAMTESATLIEGKPVAEAILERCERRVAAMKQRTGVQPCLATVIVGDDPASHTYVKMKQNRCRRVGIASKHVDLDAATTTDQLVNKIRELADDPAVHGILLQHPVPSHIDERAGFEAIPVSKDVDGVTYASFARMWFGQAELASCTPAGIMHLLDAYDVPLQGCEAVVIGRSPILGKPMAGLLLDRHATVTICHSRTRDLPDVVRRADVVIAAVGKPKFVKGDWLKPGAVVIDAGYNPGNVGDVDFDSCAARASKITPVPGGVGPMTLAVLVEQTVIAAARQQGIDPLSLDA